MALQHAAIGKQLDLPEHISKASTYLSGISTRNESPNYTMGATQASALIAIAQNDDVRAHQVLKELEPQSGTWSPGYPMSIDRLLGQLYVVVGDRIKAISHFENALEFGRNGKLLQKLVWTCSDYAEMLLDNDDASPSGEGLTDASASGISDHEKAITLQDEALVITQELGMRPLTERILARREILRG